MISIDTNLLFYGYVADAPQHEPALEFINSLRERTDVAISEFVLVEFYRLLRNPSVLSRPLTAEDATTVIQKYRAHAFWRVVGFPESDSKNLHDELWKRAGK